MADVLSLFYTLNVMENKCLSSLSKDEAGVLIGLFLYFITGSLSQKLIRAGLPCSSLISDSLSL